MIIIAAIAIACLFAILAFDQKNGWYR